MPSICFYFRAHHSVAIKKISFFEFGKPPDLIDHQQNYINLQNLIDGIYLPTFTLLQELISAYRGAFHFSLSLSGILLDQIHQYFPDYHQNLVNIIKLKEIEMIASTYFHSYAYAYSSKEFIEQIMIHKKRISDIFGKESTIFCNADLTYHSEMSQIINRQQMKGVIFQYPFKRQNRFRSVEVLYHDSKYKNLRLIPIHEKYTDAFKKGPFLSKNKSSELLKKIVLEISRHTTDLILILVDLEDPDIQEFSINKRLKFLEQFIDLSLRTGEIEFMNPSQILARTHATKGLFIHIPAKQKGIGLENRNILRKEALRYIYSLEKKIKKTDRKDLVYLWRTLQSTDQLQKINGEESLMKNSTSEKWPPPTRHEIYLDYINALSSLDIYAQNRINQSFDLFHHNPRSVR